MSDKNKPDDTADQQAAGSVEAERAAFEAYCVSIGKKPRDLERTSGHVKTVTGDDYTWGDINDRWAAWQARAYLDSRAHPAQPVAAGELPPLTEQDALEALESITHEVPKRLPPGWWKFAQAIEKKVLAQCADSRPAGGVTALSNDEAAQWARNNGLNVPAQWDQPAATLAASAQAGGVTESERYAIEEAAHQLDGAFLAPITAGILHELTARLDAAQPATTLAASVDSVRETQSAAPDQVAVDKQDANNYSRILSLLGMEEEGDPVAEIERLVAASAAQPAAEPDDDIKPESLKRAIATQQRNITTKEG